jgi:hypothetical protein
MKVNRGDVVIIDHPFSDAGGGTGGNGFHDVLQRRSVAEIRCGCTMTLAYGYVAWS